MIYPPTVGRVVWFYGVGVTPPTQPQAALVVYVHGPTCVNLAVFDHNGRLDAPTSVPFIHDGESAPSSGFYCTYMPYQNQKHKEEMAGK